MGNDMASNDNSKELTQIVKQLENIVKQQSSVGMFPNTNEEKINSSIGRTLDEFVKVFDDFKKGNLKLSKKQLSAANKILKDKGMGSGTDSRKEINRKLDEGKAMREVAKQLRKLGKTQFDSKEELDEELNKLEQVAKRAGTSLEEMGVKTTRTYDLVNKKSKYIVNDVERTFNDMEEQADEVSKAFKEIEDAGDELAENMNKSDSWFGKVADTAKIVAQDFLKLAEEERRYAQQTATADAGWVKGMQDMSISTLEYMKILKDTRIENLAMTASGGDFSKSLIESQQSLVGFTKDSSEAAEVAAAFHKSMSRIGVSQDQLGDAVQQQSKIYKENYRVLGYTADEFSKLSDELINTQGMRSVLLGLQEKERKQYVLGIQQRMAEYQTMGYTIERAKELQATFQALNGMNPKERMKQAAKTRAMMGALGMGQEGEELFKLETNYRTMNDTEKLAADKRMTEIKGQAAGVFGEKSGSGASMGQAMSFQMLADNTGFTQIAEKFETASGEGLKIDQEQLQIMKDRAKHDNEVEGWQKSILKKMDYYSAAENTAVGSVGTNIQKGILDLGAANAFGFGVVAAGISGLTSFFTGEKEEEESSSWFGGNGIKSRKRPTRSRNTNKKPSTAPAADVPIDKQSPITPVDTVVDVTTTADGTAIPTTDPSSPKQKQNQANAELEASKQHNERMMSLLGKQANALGMTAETNKDIASSFKASLKEQGIANQMAAVNAKANRTGGS